MLSRTRTDRYNNDNNVDNNDGTEIEPTDIFWDGANNKDFFSPNRLGWTKTFYFSIIFFCQFVIVYHYPKPPGVAHGKNGPH